MLIKDGYIVVIVNDGEEGVEMVLMYCYDIILMDVLMLCMDGIEVCCMICVGDGLSKDIMIVVFIVYVLFDDLVWF